MAVLTLVVDEQNISDYQYEQALKIVHIYTETKAQFFENQLNFIAKIRNTNKERKVITKPQEVKKDEVKVSIKPKEEVKPIEVKPIAEVKPIEIKPLIKPKAEVKVNLKSKTEQLKAKAKEVNEYQQLHFKEISAPIKKEEIVLDVTKEEIVLDVPSIPIVLEVPKKEVKPKEIKLKEVKQKDIFHDEKDKEGNYLYFNLVPIFSARVLETVVAYFKEFRNYDIDVTLISREDFYFMNIFKFNRISNFKPQHVITLVKFLNNNNIPCSHSIDDNNKLIANESKQFSL